MTRVRVQFISRGGAAATPEDEQLVALIPAGEAVSFGALVSALSDVYFDEAAAWMWSCAGEGCWPMAHFYSEIARREIEQAISTGVVRLTASLVERPATTSWVLRTLHVIRALVRRWVDDVPAAQTIPPR